METHRSYSIRAFIPASITLFVIGCGGLFALIYYTLPSAGPRWLFFFLFVLGLTGLALPIVAFLNQRFPSRPPVSAGVILREALWFGIFGPTLAWLQISRVLTPSIALLIAIGFTLIEWLLRLREKSQWKP